MTAAYGVTQQAGKGRKAKLERPPPLVGPFPHLMRFIGQHGWAIVLALVAVHLGVLAVSGGYYLLLETYAPVTHAWHMLVPDKPLRNAIRNVGEGVVGGFAGQLVAWSHFSHHRQLYMAKPLNRLDKIEIALRIPNLKSAAPVLRAWQVPYALAWSLVYGAPGFAILYGIDALIRHDTTLLHNVAVTLTGHSSEASRAKSIDTDDYPLKVIGFGASFFFARRPMRAVFDSEQLWHAEARYDSGKPPHRFDTAAFKARVNYLASTGHVTEEGRHGWWQTALARSRDVVFLGLAGFGYYVLTVVAVAKH